MAEKKKMDKPLDELVDIRTVHVDRSLPLE